MIKVQWRKRPDVLIRRLERAEKKLLAGVKDSSGTIARTMQRELSKRVRMARTVSRQDHPSGKRQNLPRIQPFRVELKSTERQAVVRLSVRAHYVAARTKGVKGALGYLGRLVSETRRKGLWIVPGKRSGTRARDAAGPAKFFAFRSNPRLRRWADDPKKGQQTRRHVIWLDAKMLDALLLGPTLRKNSKKIRAAWRKLVRDWSKA